jgi:hypothetical protein
VRPRQHVPLACPLAVTLLLAAPATALADSPHVMLTPAILGPIGHAIGGVFHAIAGVVLGGLKWTVDLAGKFILATLGGLIRLLIPRSWAQQGLEVMHWIVAVPNYAGTVTSPSGQSVYGFAGINALRDLFMWIGAALLPLTLVNATSRAAIGTGRHVLALIGRVLGMAAVLVSYPWWWSQAAAAVNQLTHFVLALPPVTHGIYKLMQYAVGGIALGGWQLIDLFLMGAIGVALLGLIFLKVVIILLGALLYALGPLMIGLVPTEGGVAIARAWASAAAVLMMLPLAWSTILAVGALLVNDSSTAGPLIAGSGTIAHLLGGLLLALAGLASLWLCIRAAREAGAVLRGQLAGVLTVGGGSRGVATASAAPHHRRRGERRRTGRTGARRERLGIGRPQSPRPDRRERHARPNRRGRSGSRHRGARRAQPRRGGRRADGTSRHSELATVRRHQRLSVTTSAEDHHPYRHRGARLHREQRQRGKQHAERRSVRQSQHARAADTTAARPTNSAAHACQHGNARHRPAAKPRQREHRSTSGSCGQPHECTIRTPPAEHADRRPSAAATHQAGPEAARRRETTRPIAQRR